MYPGTVDPSPLLTINVEMSMAHVGLIRLVDLLRRKPKVGGLNLQVPAFYSVGVDHQVKGGDRLARGNFKGAVVGVCMGRLLSMTGGWMGLMPRARAHPLGNP
jgi:hypothetical protein